MAYVSHISISNWSNTSVSGSATVTLSDEAQLSHSLTKDEAEEILNFALRVIIRKKQQFTDSIQELKPGKMLEAPKSDIPF